jgi:hypothetical protein
MLTESERMMIAIPLGLIILIIVLVSFGVRRTHEEVQEANKKLEAILASYREIPNVAYDNISGRCILVYSDSIVIRR